MHNFFHLTSTNSTNEDAYSLALKGAGHGTAVLADTQLGGKGRLGREWVSPAGTGLYCSIVVRPKLPFTEFPKLTLTAGLALCSVAESLLPGVPFGLKWPNDLYSEGGKCGGILVESSSPTSQNEDSFVVVGIGLNVNTTKNMFPSELQTKATSLVILGAKTLDITQVYQKIHSALLHHLHIHETNGFVSILEKWRKKDVLLGKEMQWVTCEKKLITAVGMGPDENGQLLARDRNGRVYEILSGDVQLAKQY